MIDNNQNYAREKKSKALINTDQVSFHSYRQNRTNVKKIVTLSSEVNTIKNDIEEIKLMLKQILNGSSNV